jgi:hypothetical protein
VAGCGFQRSWASLSLCLVVCLSLFGLLYSWSAAFLSIFNFLGPITSSVYLHRVKNHPFRGCLQESWPCHIFPGPLVLSLKSWWKPLWPYKFCILHACKISMMWMVKMPATSKNGTWAPLGHASLVSECLGNSIVKWVIRKQINTWPCARGMLQRWSILKGKSFKWLYSFKHLSLLIYGV